MGMPHPAMMMPLVGQHSVEVEMPGMPLPGMMLPAPARTAIGSLPIPLPPPPCVHGPMVSRPVPVFVQHGMPDIEEEMLPYPTMIPDREPPPVPVKVTACGKRIQIIASGFKARCDRVIAIEGNDRFVLEGKVRITFPSGKISAEHVTVDVRDGSYEVSNGPEQSRALPGAYGYMPCPVRPVMIKPAHYSPPHSGPMPSGPVCH
jgi:hypothetical protein